MIATCNNMEESETNYVIKETDTPPPLPTKEYILYNLINRKIEEIQTNL